jgi:hemophore-related protein
MLLSGRSTRRVLAGAIGASAITGAMLLGGSPSALADPPPGCTAADLAGVAASVSAATSGYLFDHPDVNNFFTGLKGRPKSDIRNDVQNYLNANPHAKADLQGIRQPLVDLKSRCQ